MSEALQGNRRVALRPAGDDDVEALQSVFERAGDHFLRVTGRRGPDPDAAEREIRSALSTTGREVAMVLLGHHPGSDAHPDPGPASAGEPVGAVGWWADHPEPGTALLGMLLVVEEARGRGYAREALRVLETDLAASGVTRLRTAVPADDRRSAEFLEAVGFASMDRRAHVDVDAGRLRIAFFEKSLPPAEA